MAGYTVIDKRVMNYTNSSESKLKKEITGYGSLVILNLQCAFCRKVSFEVNSRPDANEVVYKFCPHCGRAWKGEDA